jgi:hypothetical protein
MIISHLMGGLGNQMFEYAAGLTVAERNRTALKVDVSWFGADMKLDPINRYNMHCLNVPVQYATANEVHRLKGGLTAQEKIAKRLCRLLGLCRASEALECYGRAHYQKRWHYYPEFQDIGNDTYLFGNYQSEKFFAPVADLVRRQFTFRYPPTPEVEAMVQRIKAKPSVAVHFRRGDYVSDKGHAERIGVMGFEYYEQAIARIRSAMPSDTIYYCFSDDIEAIEREYRPSVPVVFVNLFKGGNFYDKIRLMSLCDHNIIANSTFSWWAAWLNANADKIVIAPKQWFAKSEHSDRDMVPESWERM